jgi:multisubunit Na+/H+ antiporter MnhF subunit
MHDAVFYIVIFWLGSLLALLALRAMRAEGVVDRVLAIDTISYVMVAVLSTIALWRRAPGYLDIALMLALLAYIQTVAAARYARDHEVIS